MEKQLKACVLKYPEGADAPFITATGKGLVAEKIVDIAEKNGIPVVKNEIAEVLCLQKCGDMIPEETYSAIAGVFAFIQMVEKRSYARNS